MSDVEKTHIVITSDDTCGLTPKPLKLDESGRGVAGRCDQPAVIYGVSRCSGRHGYLCAEHAWHFTDCPECVPLVAEIEQLTDAGA